ncbi:MAG: hypothetical protein JKX84_08850, partial [Flavobacteriales bacterium]|nr:hypothetical protein [Flavobacteriales bacterium]
DNSTIEINADELRVKAEGITANEIATGGVTTSEILDGTIVTGDIATGGVTSSDILDGTVVTGDIANGTILPADVASAGNNQVLTTDGSGNPQWQNQTGLFGSQAGDGLVNDVPNSELDVNVDNSTIEINADELRVKAEGITANEIATGAVTTSEILDGTIVSGDIAVGGVTSSNILDGTIVTGDIATGGVTSSNILDATIIGADIDPSSVVNQVLATTVADGTVAWVDPASLTTILKDGDSNTKITVDVGGADENYIRMSTGPTVGGVEHLTITPTGDVGIGVDVANWTVDRDLHVADPTGGKLLLAREDVAIAAGETLGELHFDGRDDTQASTVDASAVIRGIATDPTYGNSDKGGALAFLTKANATDFDAAATEHMRITEAGNIGIGTTDPSQKLHVVGNARISALNGGTNKPIYADVNGDLTVTGPTSGINGFWTRTGSVLSPTSADRVDMNGQNIEDFQNLIGRTDAVFPNIVLNSTGSGNNWTSQGAYISIGESGALGSASLHMTYRGDGYGFIGSGTVNNAEPGASYLRFDYNANNIYTPDNLSIGTSSTAGRLTVSGRVEFLSTTDASGAAGSGVLEIANSLRLDGNEIITNTNTVLYINNDNNGDVRFDNNTLMVDASANRVGIGTTAPGQKLHVVGTVRVSTLDQNANRIVMANANGDLYASASLVGTNLGDNLGNHTATTTLNMVNNNINAANLLTFNDPGDQEGIRWTGSAAKIFVSPFNGGNSDGYLRLINDGGIVFEPGAEDTERVTFLANGNVGIGTTAPGAKLHVASTSGSVWTWSSLSSLVSLELGQNNTGNVGSIRLNSYSTNAFVFLRPSNGNYHIDATTGQFYYNWDESVRGGSNGTIHVANQAGTEQIRLQTSGSSWLNGGNVGFGTTSPAQRVHTTGNFRSDGRNYYFGATQRLNGDNSSVLNWYGAHSTVTQMIFRDAQGSIYGRVYGDGNTANFGMLDRDGQWSLLQANDNYTQLRINNSAKIHLTSNNRMGVMTTAPSTTLDVNGTVRIRGGSPTVGAVLTATSTNGTATWSTGGGLSTTYVNWGRNDCHQGQGNASSTSVIYSGYAASSHYSHAGSGANTLCITSSWSASTPGGTYTSTADNNRARIYGIEFEMASGGISNYGPNTKAAMQDWNAVCAVCLVTGSSSQIMIPGTWRCPTGWTSHYWGYLVSTYFGQTKSEFVCMNGSPERISYGGNQNGGLWYSVEKESGALGTYENNRELVCVVCSK